MRMPVSYPTEEAVPEPGSSWIFAPLAFLYQLPLRLWAMAFLGLMVVLGLLGWELSRSNSDLGGIARPAFNDLQFAGDYKHITRLSDGTRWAVSYEQRPPTTFVGTVRHVEHWHDGSLPFMTHDVLVTTGDYADSRRVTTNVFDHHFTWWANEQPTGTINLLHIAPLNESIYNELLTLDEWQVVRIAGPEILRIDFLNADDQATGQYWQDAGCNSMLVTSVETVTP